MGSWMCDGRYRVWFVRSVAVFLLIFFVLSHGLCWLNPSTIRPTVFLPVPYGWEYNGDSGLELYSAIDFPDGMLKEKLRIARPMKNAVLSAISKGVEVFVPLTSAMKFHISYFAHHVMNLLLMGCVLLALFYLGARMNVGPEGLFVVWVWVLLAELEAMATSHTNVFQVASPAVVLLALTRIFEVEKWAIRERVFCFFLYSMFCGFVVLVKQQYAVYLAVAAFAVLTRRWCFALVWVVVFHLPWLLYRLDLHFMGAQWYSHETAAYGQGVWWLDSLQREGVLGTVRQLCLLLGGSVDVFTTYYGVVLTGLAALGLYAVTGDTFSKNIRLFAILMVGCNMIQTVAAARMIPYMFGDSFLVVGLLAAAGYGLLMQSFPAHVRVIRWAAAVFLIFTAISTLMYYLHLPWVPPWDQVKRPL